MQLLRDDAGQGLPEYALLTAAVVLAVVASLTLFRGSITQLFTAIGDLIAANGP